MRLEHKGINIENEKSLHAAIKKWYAGEDGKTEVKMNGYIIDIIREDKLIEIQTKNFSAMKRKLEALVEQFEVKVVHPIAVEKWIVEYDPTSGKVTRRKSPKKGKIYDIFKELIYITDLMQAMKFELEILFVKEEEVRANDGKGSWRRKGKSIVDHQLLEVVDKVTFQEKNDFYGLIPEKLEKPFTNKTLSKEIGMSTAIARKMTYCLKKMGGIVEVGKQGRETLFSLKQEK